MITKSFQLQYTVKKFYRWYSIDNIYKILKLKTIGNHITRNSSSNPNQERLSFIYIYIFPIFFYLPFFFVWKRKFSIVIYIHKMAWYGITDADSSMQTAHFSLHFRIIISSNRWHKQNKGIDVCWWRLWFFLCVCVCVCLCPNKAKKKIWPINRMNVRRNFNQQKNVCYRWTFLLRYHVWFFWLSTFFFSLP